VVSYDERGNPTATEYTGNVSYTVAHRNEYDGELLVRVEHVRLAPDGTDAEVLYEILYDYDAMGRRLSKTERRAQRAQRMWSFEYDDNGFLRSETCDGCTADAPFFDGNIDQTTVYHRDGSGEILREQVIPGPP